MVDPIRIGLLRAIFKIVCNHSEYSSCSRIIEHVSVYTQPMTKKAVFENPNGVYTCYRGFKRKGDRVLGCNIIVVANKRYGLKRCSGTFGPILDLNVRSLQ